MKDLGNKEIVVMLRRYLAQDEAERKICAERISEMDFLMTRVRDLDDKIAIYKEFIVKFGGKKVEK